MTNLLFVVGIVGMSAILLIAHPVTNSVQASSHTHTPNSSNNDNPKVNVIEKPATHASGNAGPTSVLSNPPPNICCIPDKAVPPGTLPPSTPSPSPSLSTPTTPMTKPSIALSTPTCEFYKGRNIGPFPCSYESSQAPPTIKTLGGNGSNTIPTKHVIIGNITGGAIIGGLIK